MFFRERIDYCLVRFEDEKTYWYRTDKHGYRVGMAVIVPVTNRGLWKIGRITKVERCAPDAVPYPLTKTKGIVEKADFLAERKVQRHNQEIERSPYPTIDISIATVETGSGVVEYCTCQREREILRKKTANSKKKYLLIENYPPSPESEIPKAARKRLVDIEVEEWNNFNELMEDLDQYN